MIIIVECGGTKSDWRLLHPDGKIESFETPGFNPVLQPIHELKDILATLEESIRQHPSEVYFFGSGIANAYYRDAVTTVIQDSLRPSHIETHSDLMAACLATSAGKPGFVSILGTGSNSCFFDGSEIGVKQPALGYILGDEGAGSQLGKRLLQAYFYELMPAHLRERWIEKYTIDLPSVLHAVYNAPKVNAYLGSFAEFAIQYRSDPFIQALIHLEFNLFIDHHLASYKEARSLPCHFVGSVAWYLREELSFCMLAKGFQLGHIVHRPIEHLATHYMKRSKYGE